MRRLKRRQDSTDESQTQRDPWERQEMGQGQNYTLGTQVPAMESRGINRGTALLNI